MKSKPDWQTIIEMLPPVKPTGPYMEVRYGRCTCHRQLFVQPKELGGHKAVKQPAMPHPTSSDGGGGNG